MNGLVKSVMKADVDAAYDEACRNTAGRWAIFPGTGNRRESAFHPTRLSLTSGNFLVAPAAVSELLLRLRQLAGDDPLADVIDPSCLHCTFLALCQPRFASIAELPDLTELAAVFARHCQGKVMRLRNLRLVALPNALLLAGTPDDATDALRKAFAADLLGSGWAELLRGRYPDGVIPPVFWHSTLVRYQADFLPLPWREFFLAHRVSCFGKVILPIDLLATSYDWKIAVQLVSSGLQAG